MAAVQVELKTTPETPDQGYLQKAADFVHAFVLGKTNVIIDWDITNK